jgi:imidazolonepropionase-like amidohydrolase
MHRSRGRRLRRAALVLVAGLLAACAGGPGSPIHHIERGTVLRNVVVVDTRQGTLSPGRAVAWEGGVIRQVLADHQVRVAAGVTTVDGQGRYLVPGYVDMHTHALGGPEAGQGAWPLFVAHGVTGIREMSGSEPAVQAARRHNAARREGRLLAPEIVAIPGDLLAAPVPPEVAVAQVRRQKAYGADFIKVVNATPASVLAVLQEAQRLQLRVAGHLPSGVDTLTAVQAGWGSIEHLGAGMGHLLDCSTEAAGIRQALRSGQGAPAVPPTPEGVVSPMLGRALDAPFFQRVLDTLDPTACDALASRIAGSTTWEVPTLVRLRSMLRSDDAAWRVQPSLAYVPPPTRALWARLADRYTATTPAAARESFARYYDGDRRFVGLLARQGAKLLAGSDVGGIWLVPGASLHDEFGELASAGLTPLQVLQSTTLNPAAFLGREADMGTIDAGKRADLVLLEADPLQSVSHLSRVHAVVVNGRLLTRAHLDALLKQAADHAGSPGAARLPTEGATHAH